MNFCSDICLSCLNVMCRILVICEYEYLGVYINIKHTSNGRTGKDSNTLLLIIGAEQSSCLPPLHQLTTITTTIDTAIITQNVLAHAKTLPEQALKKPLSLYFFSISTLIVIAKRVMKKNIYIPVYQYSFWKRNITININKCLFPINVKLCVHRDMSLNGWVTTASVGSIIYIYIIIIIRI